VAVTTQALENRKYVRLLLAEKQPQFAAALKSVERELSCPFCLGTLAGRQPPSASSSVLPDS